ncbi:MAG: hypothetical protein BGP16_13580 [Sphingobium sp. 66-54]|nr:MAG: hypothetical protein BGP16_13580 [Sphingobium sp. 66-54]
MGNVPFVVLALAAGLGTAAALVGVSVTDLATDAETASATGAAAGRGAAFTAGTLGAAALAGLRDDDLVGVVKTTSRVFVAMQHRASAVAMQGKMMHCNKVS